jgi:hypothetical protein
LANIADGATISESAGLDRECDSTVLDGQLDDGAACNSLPSACARRSQGNTWTVGDVARIAAEWIRRDRGSNKKRKQ